MSDAWERGRLARLRCGPAARVPKRNGPVKAAEVRQRDGEMQRQALENNWRANDLAERNLCRGTALCDNAAGHPAIDFFPR